MSSVSLLFHFYFCCLKLCVYGILRFHFFPIESQFCFRFFPKKKVNFVCQINQIDGMALHAIFFSRRNKNEINQIFRTKKESQRSKKEQLNQFWTTLMAPRWKAAKAKRNTKEIKTICHFRRDTTMQIMLLLFFI